MAENEKDVPVSEQEDGSALVSVDLPDEIEVVEEKEGGRVESSDNEHDDEHDDEPNEGETAEEREKIREARREERKLKKELAKQREYTARNKISALE